MVTNKYDNYYFIIIIEVSRYPGPGNDFENTRYPGVFDFQKISPNKTIFMNSKYSYFI